MVAIFEGFDLRSECFEQHLVVRAAQFSHYRVVVIKEPALALAMVCKFSNESATVSFSFFVFKY